MILTPFDKSSFKHLAKELYLSSFPFDERREWSSILDLNQQDYYSFFVIEQDSLFVGIISLWFFKDFVYVEHFAIDKTLRGNHLGTQAISHIINNINANIVLEVELPTNEISKKRIMFYKRLGFESFVQRYIQPPYTEQGQSLELIVMFHQDQPTTSFPSFETIRHTLYHNVYGR